MAKFFIPDGGTEMDSTSYIDDSMVTFRYDGGETPTFLVNGTEFVPDEKWNEENNDNQIDCVCKYDYINEDNLVEDSIYVSFQDGLPVEVSRDVDEVRSNIEVIRDPDSSTIESVKYHATNAEIEVKYDKEYGLGYIDVSIDGKQAAIYDNNENALQDASEKIEFKAVVITDDGEIKAYSFVEGDDGNLLLPKEVEYDEKAEFVRDADRPYTIEAADNFEKEYSSVMVDETAEDIETQDSPSAGVENETINDNSVVDKEDMFVDKPEDIETEIVNGKGEVVVSVDGELSPCIEIDSYDYKTGELRSADEYYDGFHVYTRYEKDDTIKSVLYSDIDGEKSVCLATEVYDKDGKCISSTYHEEKIDSAFASLFMSSDKVDDTKSIEIKEIIDKKTEGEVIAAFKDFGVHTYDDKVDSKQEKLELLKDVVSLSDRLQDAFDNGDRKNADQSVFDDRKEIRGEIDDIKRDICKIPDDVFKYRVGELQDKIEQLDSRVDSVCEKLGVGDKPADIDKETVVEKVPMPESLKDIADDALKEKYDELSKAMTDYEKRIDYFKDDTSKAEIVGECLTFLRDNFSSDEISTMVIDKMEPEKYATEIKYKDEDVDISFSKDGKEQYADVYKEDGGERKLDRREVMDLETGKLSRVETYFGDANLGKIDYFNDAQQNNFTVKFSESGQIDSYVEKMYDSDGKPSTEIEHNNSYRTDTVFKEDGSEKFIYMPVDSEGGPFECVGKEISDKDGLVTAEYDVDKLSVALDNLASRNSDLELSQEKLNKIQELKDSISHSENPEEILSKIQEINNVYLDARQDDVQNDRIDFVRMLDASIENLTNTIEGANESSLDDKELAEKNEILDELKEIKSEFFEGSGDKFDKDETAMDKYKELASTLSDRYGEENITEILSVIEKANDWVERNAPEDEKRPSGKGVDKPGAEAKQGDIEKEEKLVDAVKSYLDRIESSKDADSLKSDKEYQYAKQVYEKYCHYRDSYNEGMKEWKDLVITSKDYYIQKDNMMKTVYERKLCCIAKDNPEIASGLAKIGFEDGMGRMSSVFSAVTRFNSSDFWGTLVQRGFIKLLDSMDKLPKEGIFEKKDVEKPITRGDIINNVTTFMANVDAEGYEKFEKDTVRTYNDAEKKEPNDTEVKEPKDVDTDKPEDKDLDKTEDKDLDKTDDKDLDKTDDKDLDKTEDKDLDKTDDKDLDKTDDKDLDKTEDKDLDKTEDKDLDKTEDKDLDKTDDKDLDKTEDKDLDKTEDKDLDKTTERDEYDADDLETTSNKNEDESSGSSAEEIYESIKEKIDDYLSNDDAEKNKEDGAGETEFSDIVGEFNDKGIDFSDNFADVVSDYFSDAFSNGESFSGDGLFSLMDNAASEMGVSFLELCDTVASAIGDSVEGAGDAFYNFVSEGISMEFIESPGLDDIHYTFGDVEYEILSDGDDVFVFSNRDGEWAECTDIDVSTVEDAMMAVTKDAVGETFADNMEMFANALVDQSGGELEMQDAMAMAYDNVGDVVALGENLLDTEQASQMAMDAMNQDNNDDVALPDIEPQNDFVEVGNGTEELAEVAEEVGEAIVVAL